MASNDPNDSTAPAAPVVVDPVVEQVTLEEFCIQLSIEKKTPELIGGFHFVEKQAQHFKDAASNYAARFAAYVNKPV